MCLFAVMTATCAHAQRQKLPFYGYFSNAEYDIYLKINFYDNNVTVPGQEIFGEMSGFLGDKKDLRKWLFTSAEVNGDVATLQITNDYGSEDLTATLTKQNDSVFVLRQTDGSQIKIARNRKWVKIPKTISFKKAGATKK